MPTHFGNFVVIFCDTKSLVTYEVGYIGSILKIKQFDLTQLLDRLIKTGKDIYGIIVQHFRDIPSIENPQIMVVVSSPEGKEEIRQQLLSWEKKPMTDFWFFA